MSTPGTHHRMRHPYDTPTWRAVLGLPPVHLRYAVIETNGRRHITNTQTQQQQWLETWDGATAYSFQIPEEETPQASLAISPQQQEGSEQGEEV